MGVGLATVGGVLLGQLANQTCVPDDLDCADSAGSAIGVTVGGTILAIGGATMLVVGLKRRSKRAPEGLLDNGSISEMSNYSGASIHRVSAAPRKTDGVHFALAPLVAPKQGGLMGLMTF